MRHLGVQCTTRGQIADRRAQFGEPKIPEIFHQQTNLITVRNVLQSDVHDRLRENEDVGIGHGRERFLLLFLLEKFLHGIER